MDARLHQYIIKHQQDWSAYFRPPAYAYSIQVHRTTEQLSFRLTLSLESLRTITLAEARRSFEEYDEISSTVKKSRVLNRTV